MRKSLGSFIVGIALALFGNGEIRGQIVVVQSGPDFTVTTNDDHNDGACSVDDCTLREAITAANANADTSTITFNLAGAGPHTIQLTTALPDLSTNLNIAGPTDKSVIVRGEGSADPYRIFTIQLGQTINLSRLTISNGAASGSYPANAGGAIFNRSSALTINECTISGNNASTYGGAIFNDSSQFPNNATLTITNSTLSGNSTANYGGAIYNSGVVDTATLTITNSTLSGNSADIGGAIYNSSHVINGFAILRLTNATLTNNRADADNNGSGFGGAILTDFAPATCTMNNTIVAGNFKGTGSTPDDIAGRVNTSSSSFNLIGTGGAGDLTNGTNNNQVGVSDPRLGPLADNGGPTRTHALIPGSPAIEAGSNSFITNPPFTGPPFWDQRGTGYSRIADGPDADPTVTVDIGAYEVHASVEDITDKTTAEDTPLSFSFNVGDAASITNVSVTSANPTLVPNANLILTGSGSTRTLQITPAANLSGTSLITVTVTAGTESVTDTFLLTVTEFNDAPTATNDTLSSVAEDSGPRTIPFTDLTGNDLKGGGAEESTQTLIVKTVTNPVGGTVEISGSNILFTPTANFNGAASFQYTVEDNGTTNGVADPKTSNATVSFNINAVNDAPINSVPGAQVTDEDTPLTFSAANSNLISISDVDAGANAIQVTLTATNGTLTLSSSAGLSFTTGDGTADATMTFTGTLSAINTALAGLVFTPPTGFNGSSSLQITTNDLGNTGLGGALTDIDTIQLTVNQRALRLSSASYSAGEADGRATITVTRTGGITQPASVQYATSDLSGLNNCDVVTGNASARCDYTAVGGTLSFAAGESSKSFTVPIINDVYVEGPETLTVTLSNAVGGVVGTPSVATVTITDDDLSQGAANPILTREFFIRQLYLDTLNREPEPPGLAAWLNRLNTCPQPGETIQNCDEIEVASAFFRSPEFFDRSYFIYKFYEVAFGRQPQYDEYQRDLRRVTGFLTSQELEARKLEFISEFMSRQEFRDRYDALTDPLSYVAALDRTAGVTPAIENQLIGELGNGLKTRGEALRAITETPEVNQKFFNKAFVVIGYFAFLRRNPDINYLIWIERLNTTGDYREMIRGFMQSPEYRLRFGPI